MDIEVVNAYVTQVLCDLLVMKHANGFHGADRAVAGAVGFNGSLAPGQTKLFPGTRLSAKEVIFVGVGPLVEFRYEQIQAFGALAIRLALQHKTPVKRLCTTVHGPGYGLDLQQAFLSLIAGIRTEWNPSEGSLQKITIAKRSDKRCELLRVSLERELKAFGLGASVGAVSGCIR